MRAQNALKVEVRGRATSVEESDQMAQYIRAPELGERGRAPILYLGGIEFADGGDVIRALVNFGPKESS